MTFTPHNNRWLLFALPLVGAVAGCCCEAFPLPGEAGCPTDARRIYCGPGEEAVRRCPCGPDREYYGLKPTDWRPWPEGWRCGQYPCESQNVMESISHEAAAAPAIDGEVVNPFRNRSPEELPGFVMPLNKNPDKPQTLEEHTTKQNDAQKSSKSPPAVEKAHGDDAGPTNTSPPSGPLPKGTDLGVEPAPLQLPSTDATPAPSANDSQIPASLPPTRTTPTKTEAPAVPPEDPNEEKSTSEDGPLPKLIAAQNARPVVDDAIANSPSPPAPLPTPKALPPLIWSGRTKVQQASASQVHPPSAAQVPPTTPVSKRVTQHLTHNLAN